VSMKTETHRWRVVEQYIGHMSSLLNRTSDSKCILEWRMILGILCDVLTNLYTRDARSFNVIHVFRNN
jgi:hypothetical protein